MRNKPENRLSGVCLFDTPIYRNPSKKKLPAFETDTYGIKRVWQKMRVWLQIKGSLVQTQPGPILSWRLIMK